MPAEYDNDLLNEGLLHFKAKEFSLARHFFERALEVADDLQTRAQACYYLSQLVEDPGQKRQYLEEALAIDMGNALARRQLAMIDGKLSPEGIINPDYVPSPTSSPQPVQADRFTCPNCGGRMVYTPSGRSLVCENCSHQQHLEVASPVFEQDFFVAMANGKAFRRTISLKTFHCQGCGSLFMLASSELSATCAYCGSMHVLVMQTVRELVAPDAILPMLVDQSRAVRQLAGWVMENHLELDSQGQPPRGLYLPFWAFDVIGSLPWSGRIIRDHQEVPVSGEVPAVFNNICVPALSRRDKLFSKLLPGYDLRALTAYDPRFLAGWIAQVYQLIMSEAALEARRLVVERLRDGIRAAQGRVTDLLYTTSAISITSYQLLLLPVWVASCISREKSWQVFINGQTGTVHGVKTGEALRGRQEGLPAA